MNDSNVYDNVYTLVVYVLLLLLLLLLLYIELFINLLPCCDTNWKYSGNMATNKAQMIQKDHMDDNIISIIYVGI